MNQLKIAVIGSGSAGILSLCHFLFYTQHKVYSISDPNIKSVGIGESTNPVFWGTVRDCLSIDEQELFEKKYIDATLKYCTLYKDWRKEDFQNPLFNDFVYGKSYTIHFDTFKIKEFAFDIIKTKYDQRFDEILGNVKSIENDNDSAKILVDEQYYNFDYVIDCRGFPKDVNEQYHSLNMLLNRALIHNVKGDYPHDIWGYTLHQATKDGWMFGVPLRSRISYGYLFNDNITSPETARRNFSNLIEVPESSLQHIEYRFKSYYAKNLVNNRIIKNGNAAVFLEPMFANSLWIYDYINRLTYDYINNNSVDTNILNFHFHDRVKCIHDLICYYYKGGSNIDSDFWTFAKNHSNDLLKDSLVLKTIDKRFEYMRENKCFISSINSDLSPYSTDSLINLDKFLGYGKWYLND